MAPRPSTYRATTPVTSNSQLFLRTPLSPMKNRLLTLLLLLVAFPVFAQNRYTIKLTVTNSPVQGNSYTLNGSTRTFTTNPVLATDMLLTNDIPSAANTEIG